MKYCDVGQRLLERIGAYILHGKNVRFRHELDNIITHLDSCEVCSDYALQLWLHTPLGQLVDEQL